MFVAGLPEGKWMLIAGGGSGLGKSMAQRIMERGGEPVICGRRAGLLDVTAAELSNATGGTISWKPLDIRDAEAVEATVAAIWEEGPVDALINNAAGNFLARTETLSYRALDAVIAILLHGTAYMGLQQALDLGREAGERPFDRHHLCMDRFRLRGAVGDGQGRGTGDDPQPCGGMGTQRHSPQRHRPGPFPTQGAWERLVPRDDLANVWETRNPLGRTGEHEELTNLVAYLLADQSAYINGEVVTIDSGEWLAGAGQFNFAGMLSDEDWDEITPKRG